MKQIAAILFLLGAAPALAFDTSQLGREGACFSAILRRLSEVPKVVARSRSTAFAQQEKSRRGHVQRQSVSWSVDSFRRRKSFTLHL